MPTLRRAGLLAAIAAAPVALAYRFAVLYRQAYGVLPSHTIHQN